MIHCKHCQQEMSRGVEGHVPHMCPNVELFMNICGTDTLTGNAYEADANPIHCTQAHVDAIEAASHHKD